MGVRNAADEATPYLLESAELAEVVNLVQARRDRGIEVPRRRPALVDADGKQLKLRQPMFDALLQVVKAMSAGRAVTIARHNAKLLIGLPRRVRRSGVPGPRRPAPTLR